MLTVSLKVVQIMQQHRFQILLAGMHLVTLRGGCCQTWTIWYGGDMVITYIC
jgi:hypothetical protein